MVGSNDLQRSRRFYDKVLGVLGLQDEVIPYTAESGHQRLYYRHRGGLLAITEPIDGEPATSANGATIGFACESPEQVIEFHDVAVANGGTSIEEPPGARVGGMGPMYLSYVRDPDGHKLCAIYRPAKP